MEGGWEVHSTNGRGGEDEKFKGVGEGCKEEYGLGGERVTKN